MLAAYIDDTGTDGRCNLVTLAGWIATEEQWRSFSEDWLAQLVISPRVQAFHMTEAQGRRASPWKTMSPTMWEVRVSGLASTISYHKLKPVGFTVPWDWMETNVPRRTHVPSEDAMRICVRSIIETVSRQCYDDGHRDAVSICFDRQASPSSKKRFAEVAHWTANDIAKGRAGRRHCKIGRITFSDRAPRDKEIPLQAADMLAWHINRIRHRPDEKRAVYQILQRNGPIYTDMILSESLRKYGVPIGKDRS